MALYFQKDAIFISKKVGQMETHIWASSQNK